MELSLTDVLLRLLLGLVIGFCIGLTGSGGGALTLPALTVILGLPASVAVGTASLYAFLARIYATYRHFKLKTIDLAISAFVLLGAVPGNIIVSFLINRQVGKMQDNDQVLSVFQKRLEVFIAVVIVVSAVMLVINLIIKRRKKESAEKDPVRKLGRYPFLRRASACGLGVVLGAMMGATSVGGGVFIVPMLIIFIGLSPSRAVGTSIFVAVILALITSVVYFMGSQIDVPTSLFMAAGSLVGIYWGSKLSVMIPEKLLQGILVVVIFAAALLMIAK